MKYLDEFINYLKKEGYEDKYFDCMDGYLLNVDCFYQNKKITFFVEPTKDFEKFIKEKIEKEGEFEYEIDYKNYLVKSISIESTITFSRTIGQIILISNPNEEESRYKHGFEYFEKCVQLQKVGMVDHELFILEKHVEHLKWAKEVLIPLLEKADYVIDFSSIFDLRDQRINSNLKIIFKHYNDEFYLDDTMYIETDCLSGECLFPNNIDIYGKTKKEVWNILVEEFWKKAKFPKRYSYLYTEGETKETFKNLNKIN